MSHSFLTHPYARRSLYLTVSVALLAIVGAFFIPRIAYGVGAGGSGGPSQGGGTGGAWAKYGYGWYQFSTTDTTLWPDAFRNPQTYNGQPLTWPGAARLCNDLGAASIIAFVINQNTYYFANGITTKLLLPHSIVYDYEGWNNLNNYFNRNVSSGNYLSISGAYDAFNNSGLTGLNWGGPVPTVGWFCYNFVPRDYALTPIVTSNVSGIVAHGASVTFNHSVTKTGVDSRNTNIAVKQYVIPPGGTFKQDVGMLDSVTTNNDPRYQSGGVSADTLYQGTRTFTASTTTISDLSASVLTVDTGGYTPGTLICRILALDPPTQKDDTPRGRWSAPICVKIGKKPSVQIWGGDLISAGAVNAGIATKTIDGTERTFGSWIEYGIFAARRITGAASGSAYAGPPPGLVKATVCKESQLSFTNAGCKDDGVIGNYANSPSIPDVGASFSAAGAPSIDGGDLLIPTKSGVFTTSGVTLSGGNIQKGRWVVINAPDATVTIAGDIKYTDDQLSSVSDIPQVIIIANKIIINSNVTRVDAWLVANGAKGIIETCNVNSLNYVLSGTDRLTVNKCNLPLIVNGPVMAKKLWLRRTGGSGSGPASGDPAEVFNLRPDAYMWANLHSAGNNRVQTVYSTELPPRL